MKKRFLLYFLIGCFFWMPNVFAYNELNVCSDCQYHTLDEAFTVAETYSINDSVLINIYDTDAHYTISNHTFYSRIDIMIPNGNISIDGNGSTIRNNYCLYFHNHDDATIKYDFELKNINFVGSNVSGAYGFLGIWYFDDVEVSNIFIQENNSPFDEYYAGIDAYRIENLIIDSVEIKGFSNGIYIDEIPHSNISNSKLLDNKFSIDLYYNSIAVVENTTLSYLHNSLSSFELELYDDRKLIVEDISYLGDNYDLWYSFRRDVINLYNSGDYEQYLRIYESEPRNSLIKKSISMGSDSVDLLDTWFGEDCYELRDFDIDNINTDIVSIENGIIKPLKNGTGKIVLTNKDNDTEYQLYITVDMTSSNPESSSYDKKPQNNPKTSNSLMIVSIIVSIMFCSIGIFASMKQQ